MSIVSWNSSLEIGHPIIDEQHKNLINLINKLQTAITDNFANDEIKRYMMELYNYTAYHFNQEESLMRKAEYKDLNNHLAAHEEFIRNLDTITEKIAENKDITIAKETINFLLQWLLRHISATDDVKLVECLPKKLES